MQADLKSFWTRFQTGIEVAVASTLSDKLLGVREGFLRYFHDGIRRPVPIVVVQHQESDDRGGLAMSDEETIELARGRARELRDELGDAYHFYVGSEGGLQCLEIEGVVHYFVRNWTAVVGTTGEAWGASGSLEIPGRLIAGLEGQQIPFAIPGTRRGGGMISSLTGRMESRRTAVATATFHALSSLFYGVLEARPAPRR